LAVQHGDSQLRGGKTMENLTSTIMAEPIGRAASASQERGTDRVPYSVAVDLGDDTLVITLHEVFSPAEKTLPQAGTDAAQMQEIYRQFIADASASLRQHMKRLADERVPEAAEVSRRVRGRPTPNGWETWACSIRRVMDMARECLRLKPVRKVDAREASARFVG